jgi:hypothetical protein
VEITVAFKFILFALLTVLATNVCIAGEDLISSAQQKNGEIIPYVLNYNNRSPSYVLILFPGGSGIVDPHMENGQLVYRAKNNFLLRAREFFVDNEFVTVSTNSTQVAERIQAIIDDLKMRFPAARIYLIGNSKGTYDTMRLAAYLSDNIAGEIHTSSLQNIYYFNAKIYANRHLVVHHRNDSCHVTPFAAAEGSHVRYGNDFIAMEGGISVGDPCEAFAHHGYNGIEKETADAIKQWIKQGD